VVFTKQNHIGAIACRFSRRYLQINSSTRLSFEVSSGIIASFPFMEFFNFSIYEKRWVGQACKTTNQVDMALASICSPAK